MARRGARVTGLDLAAEVLEVARAHARNAGIEVSYQLESAEDHARLRAGQYDIVTCMEMLEHVPDPPAVITALAALVKPGGAVFLSTINRTPRAYVQAVVAADTCYACCRPARTLTRSSSGVGAGGLGSLRGARARGRERLDYDPFGRSARLTGDARVNYVMQLRRTGGAMEPG
jgi:2-polyprenyl-6-hydroxyphenyl methylase/3-demethylubiquinone-9 3-methyltransferase